MQFGKILDKLLKAQISWNNLTKGELRVVSARLTRRSYEEKLEKAKKVPNK